MRNEARTHTDASFLCHFFRKFKCTLDQVKKNVFIFIKIRFTGWYYCDDDELFSFTRTYIFDCVAFNLYVKSTFKIMDLVRFILLLGHLVDDIRASSVTI